MRLLKKVIYSIIFVLPFIIGTFGYLLQGEEVAAALYETKVANIVELQKAEIDDIDYALTKIKNKTYGICEMCNDEIDIERLKFKPHAKYCIDCREHVEKTQILEQKLKTSKNNKE